MYNLLSLFVLLIKKVKCNLLCAYVSVICDIFLPILYLFKSYLFVIKSIMHIIAHYIISLEPIGTTNLLKQRSLKLFFNKWKWNIILIFDINENE